MDVELRLSEVMAALSHALDISDGHPAGHATRTCLIGMRVADEIDLDPADRSALFYGLLLKDLGCSSNAARLSSLYGADDHVAKRNAKRIDQTRLTEALAYIVRNSGGIRDLAAGARRRRQDHARGDRGRAASAAPRSPACSSSPRRARRRSTTSTSTGTARATHTAWRARRSRSSRGSRASAQTTEVFLREFGLAAALEMAEKRSGRWFDPGLVRILRSLGEDRDFWRVVESEDAGARVAALEPEDRVVIADEATLDRVAEAFAQVIDVEVAVHGPALGARRRDRGRDGDDARVSRTSRCATSAARACSTTSASSRSRT